MESTLSLYWMVFGVFTAIGGLMGFIKAQSKASLIAGGVSGAILIGASIWSKSNPFAGHLLGTVISFLLFGRFLAAYLKSKKPFPALPMILLGLIGELGGILFLTGVL